MVDILLSTISTLFLFTKIVVYGYNVFQNVQCMNNKPVWYGYWHRNASLGQRTKHWADNIHLQGDCALQWRHNGHHSFSNHQPYNCLLNHLFRRRSNKTSKLRVTGLCVGNSPWTGEFLAQMASNAENVSIWWRHHESLEGIQIAKPMVLKNEMTTPEFPIIIFILIDICFLNTAI